MSTLIIPPGSQDLILNDRIVSSWRILPCRIKVYHASGCSKCHKPRCPLLSVMVALFVCVAPRVAPWRTKVTELLGDQVFLYDTWSTERCGLRDPAGVTLNLTNRIISIGGAPRASVLGHLHQVHCYLMSTGWPSGYRSGSSAISGSCHSDKGLKVRRRDLFQWDTGGAQNPAQFSGVVVGGACRDWSWHWNVPRCFVGTLASQTSGVMGRSTAWRPFLLKHVCRLLLMWFKKTYHHTWP